MDHNGPMFPCVAKLFAKQWNKHRRTELSSALTDLRCSHAKQFHPKWGHIISLFGVSMCFLFGNVWVTIYFEVV